MLRRPGSGTSLARQLQSHSWTNERAGLRPRDRLAPRASIAELYRFLVRVSATRGPPSNWFLAAGRQQECRVGPPGLPVKGAAARKLGPETFRGSDNSRGGERGVQEVPRDLTVRLPTPLSSFFGRYSTSKICHKELVRPGRLLQGEACQKSVVKSHKNSNGKLVLPRIS